MRSAKRRHSIDSLSPIYQTGLANNHTLHHVFHSVWTFSLDSEFVLLYCHLQSPSDTETPPSQLLWSLTKVGRHPSSSSWIGECVWILKCDFLFFLFFFLIYFNRVYSKILFLVFILSVVPMGKSVPLWGIRKLFFFLFYPENIRKWGNICLACHWCKIITVQSAVFISRPWCGSSNSDLWLFEGKNKLCARGNTLFAF